MKIVYRCEHCCKESYDEKIILEHEKDCPYNPADQKRRSKQLQKDSDDRYFDEEYN